MRKTSAVARLEKPTSIMLGEQRGNFLVSRFARFDTLNDVYRAIARAHCGETMAPPPEARSRVKRIEMALEQAFFPTGAELAGGLRVLSAIEMMTQARGNDFVEVNQHAARVSYNAQTETYSLAQAQKTAPYQCWLVICGPLSMLLEKLLYALRSLLGPFHRYDHVVRYDDRGVAVEMLPADFKQIPLLIVKMPIRPTESGLYFAVIDALTPFLDHDVIEREGIRRRRMDAYVPTLVRGLLSLHVGAIAIIGVRAVHAQAAHLPYFYAALEWLKASGIAIIFCTSPALPAMEESGLSPLRYATEDAILVDTYADDDLANLAKYWWALLERDEDTPFELVPILGQINAQRELVLMLFRQLHYELRVMKKRLKEALTDIVARACASRIRQMELWAMETVPYKDGLIYRDWLPLDTKIELPPEPATYKSRPSQRSFPPPARHP